MRCGMRWNGDIAWLRGRISTISSRLCVVASTASQTVVSTLSTNHLFVADAAIEPVMEAHSSVAQYSRDELASGPRRRQ